MFLFVVLVQKWEGHCFLHGKVWKLHLTFFSNFRQVHLLCLFEEHLDLAFIFFPFSLMGALITPILHSQYWITAALLSGCVNVINSQT